MVSATNAANVNSNGNANNNGSSNANGVRPRFPAHAGEWSNRFPAGSGKRKETLSDRKGNTGGMMRLITISIVVDSSSYHV